MTHADTRGLENLESRLRLARVADACGLIVAGLGLSVVVGWLFDLEPLKRVLPSFASMKLNTALALVAGGVALRWRARARLRLVLAGVMAVLGAASLMEDLVGVDLHIDQVLLRDVMAPSETGFSPGRMAPTTALCLLLLGLALMGTVGPRQRPRRGAFAVELVALLVTVIAAISFIAYPTGAVHLRQLPGFVSIAMHTAAALVLLGLGLLCAADGLVAQSVRLQGTGRVLWLGFGVLICLLATVGIVFSVNLEELAEDIDAQANVARPRREVAIELEKHVLAYGLAVQLALSGDAQRRGAAVADVTDVEGHLSEYGALIRTDEERRLEAQFRAQWREVETMGSALLGAAVPPSQGDLARFADARLRLQDLLEDELQPDATHAFEARQAVTLAALRSVGNWPWALLVASLLLALVTSGAVARTVIGQERTLRDQSEWLRVTLSSIGDGVIACDTERRVTFLNPVAAAHTGWTQEEALGRPMSGVLRLVDEETGGPANDIVAQVLRERRVVGLANHTALISRDGRQVPIEDSAAPMTDNLGALTGAVLVFHDVGQRRQALSQLTESEARLNRAEEIAHLGSWELDLVADRLTWSDEVFRIGGVAREGFGANFAAFLAIVHPEDRRLVEMAFARSLEKDDDVYELVHRIVRQSTKEVRTVHEKGQHFRDGTGRVVRSSGMVHDITERTRAEEALWAANEQLVEADRRKNEFLAVLSHELRNPLAPIRNSLYVLEHAAPGGEQARRAQQVIGRQSGHLSRLVDDLLDVTRISQNKIRLERQNLDLGELVRRTMEDLCSVFEKNGVALEARLPAECVEVNGDATRLAQVVGNLLQNAAKFTKRGGRATVSISVDASSRRAELRVSDSGVGIEPELLGRLFEPFMQADTTLDRSKGGLGLGLALVKGLVELHGGDVQVRSEGPGKGSEFLVRLPLVQWAVHVPGERPGAAAPGRRVLIIEDNVDAADSLREVLELGAHEVAVAYSGAEGLTKAREFQPDVVLCDIGLPGMSGFDVARSFKAEEGLKSALLVALSGYTMQEDLQRATEAGFERHLAKPPNIAKLEALLGTL